MKKIAVTMSLILILSFFTFTPALAQQEIIAEPSVAAGNAHVLGLNQYGRVFSAGDNTYGQCLTYNWVDITQICAGRYFSAGLCSDGTVVIAGTQSDGTEIDVSGLSGIVQISAGDNFLAARDVDGNVFISGSNDSGNIDTSQWTDIEKIACGKDHVVGLKSGGTCVGAGKGGEASLEEFLNITDIYAGADLTVLKDNTGVYYHAGSVVGVTGYEEFDTYWESRDWENISQIVISVHPGTNGNGIVTAIKNDGSIVTDEVDGNIICNYLSDGKKIEINAEVLNVKNLAVGNGYAVCIDEENSVNLIGDISSDETLKNEYLNEILEFDLTMEPLREVYIKKPQVVVATNTVAIVLPNGQVKSIGKQDLSQFKDIKQLSADMGFDYNDIFIGVNTTGVAVSNLDDDGWLEEWVRVLKVAPTVCSRQQKIAVALRWDKKMLCYGTDPLEIDGVVDIACGNGFISYLKDSGEAGIYEKNVDHTTIYPFDVTGWSNIEGISNGMYHIVGLKNDGKCVATGGFKSSNAKKTGECNVTEWENVKDVLCGEKFTVALREDGMCEFTGWNVNEINTLKDAIIKTDENDTEYWENVSQIYASKNTIVAYKEDGTFDCVTASSTADLSQLENTYYKDNVFYTYKIDGSTATIEYYSDKEIEAYISYFDAAGNPVDFEKVILPTVDELTKETFTSEKDAVSCMVSIGTPTAEKMKFYLEEVVNGEDIEIKYCSDEARRITVAFYDEKNNMMDVKVKTDAMTKINYSCSGAAKYKLFIWDGITPLYKSEGPLN